MWNIPPIIGQKVMLDPSYVHYKDFNRAQARGKDGYILAVTGMSVIKWLLGACEPAITVMWENGHENSYELKALLPIDSFKTIERVEFMGGNFLNVVDEKSRDYIAERVIMKNDDIKHYNFFDKEKRLDILRKAEATFQTLEDSNQNKESVQMKYMSILEEIERTKRAEEVTLFLEHELEGDDASTRKKHLNQDQVTTALSGLFDGHVRGSTLDQSNAPGRIIPVLGSVERTQSDFDRLVASLNSAPQPTPPIPWWDDDEDEDI